MVYCTKCGTQNPDDAVNCSKCGNPLHVTETYPGDTWRHHHSHYRRYEKRGPQIGGILIGLFIILVGVSVYAGWDIWSLIWPFIFIAIGIAIIYGAIVHY